MVSTIAKNVSVLVALSITPCVSGGNTPALSSTTAKGAVATSVIPNTSPEAAEAGASVMNAVRFRLAEPTRSKAMTSRIGAPTPSTTMFCTAMASKPPSLLPTAVRVSVEPMPARSAEKVCRTLLSTVPVLCSTNGSSSVITAPPASV
jgi:hypothetical protein